jgi:hypothetical protein
MPKITADYSQTIIYKFCCKDTNIKDVYIGHTTNFTQRKSAHKSGCYNEAGVQYNKLLYECIRDNGGWDNWSMIQIEQVECKNKREADAIEHKWIEGLAPSLNINKPYAMCTENPVTYKHDWYETNKPAILEKAKDNYEANKDEKLAYQKQYAGEHKEIIKDYQTEYRENNKEKLSADKKVYRENNKEKAAAAGKEWREKNKEQIKEKNSQAFTCADCGGQYTLKNKNRHLTTKKHLGEEELEKTEEETHQEKDEQIVKLRASQKAYREKNVEKIKEFKCNYNETNKEKISAKCKEYYEKNKIH